VASDKLVGRLIAPGTPTVDLTWSGSVFLAGGEVIPAPRVAAWADAGYIEWADDSQAWFAERHGPDVGRSRSRAVHDAGRPQQAVSRRMGRGPRALIAAGITMLLFACTVMVVTAAVSGTFTDAALPSGTTESVAPWAMAAGFALLLGPAAIVAGSIAGSIQRHR
jgi:hypothetical protein